MIAINGCLNLDPSDAAKNQNIKCHTMMEEERVRCFHGRERRLVLKKMLMEGDRQNV